MKKIIVSTLLILMLVAGFVSATLGETMLTEGDTFVEGGIRYQVHADKERGTVLVPAEFLQPDILYSFNVRGLEVGIPWDYYRLGFLRNKEIVKTVTFANGTRTIPTTACAGMPNLTTAVLPPGVETIQYGAFEHCEELTSVNFPEGLVTIEPGAFWGCVSLTDVHLPGTLQTLQAGVFGNTAVADLVLPEGMASIEPNAFSSAAALRRVTIPSTVSSIGDSAFSKELWTGEIADETMVEIEITLSPHNPHFVIAGGCLFTSDRTQLLYVPPRASGAFQVPAGVTAIQNGAFSGCDGISELTLPEGVTMLPNSVCHMQGLKRINLPSTIEIADTGILTNASSLEWIEIAADHSSARSIDGVLYSADGNTLIQYPAGRTGSFTVPDSVQAIGYCAFYNSKLCELAFGDNAFPSTEINLFGYDSAIERLTIGAGFQPPTTPGVLGGMPNLKEVVVTDGHPWFQSIDGVLFAADGSTLLKCPEGRTGSYTAPNGTQRIGEGAFSSSKLDEIILPEGVVEIMDCAFASMSGTVHIPASATALSESALQDTRNVQFIIAPAHPVLRVDGQFVLYENELYHAFGEFGDAVIFPLGITRIPAGLLYEANAGEVRSVVIPEGVTVIEEHALNQLTRLQHVSLPFSLLEIDDSAFSQCVSLEKVILPPRLEKIGDGAFAGCQRLGSIALPDSLTTIGYNAFAFAGFGFMDQWDEYNPTPTNFVMTGMHGEIARWAAYMNRCLWLDGAAPNAEPIRIESLLPADVMSAAVLATDTASAGVDLYGDPSCRSSIGNVPNGTPVYIVAEENGAVRFRFIDTLDYAYVPKASTIQADKLTGDYIPIYTKLRGQETKPSSYSMYTSPRDGASTFSVPFVDSMYMRVLENLGTWLKVATHDGQVGYMPTNQVITFYNYAGKNYDPYRGSDLAVVANPNATDRLNLRENPDRSSAALGKYFNGTVVEILEYQDNWVHVNTPDGKTGWMMSEYLHSTALWPSNLLRTYEGNG